MTKTTFVLSLWCDFNYTVHLKSVLKISLATDVVFFEVLKDSSLLDSLYWRSSAKYGTKRQDGLKLWEREGRC